MGKLERRQIREDLISWSFYDLDGRLEDAIAKLEELRLTLGDDINIYVDYDYDDSGVINFYRMREETDAEYQKRVDRYNKSKAKEKKNREERERKEYERLRKKFEG